jgi:hypothetical protein
VIAHAEKNSHRDVHRFEKISNIIKQFKLSCSKLAAQFQVSEQRAILNFTLRGELCHLGVNFVT